MFTKLDKNKDGKLDKSEFAFKRGRRHHHEGATKTQK